MNKNFGDKLKNMPLGIYPTSIGVMTLSNVYLALGYTWIRHIAMIATTIIIILGFVRIVMHFDVFKAEYSNTIKASIYGGYSICIIVLGSYYFDFNNSIGKGIWFFGLTLHVMHIIAFTYFHVIHGFRIRDFLPTFFITYFTIVIADVIGLRMNEPDILKFLMYYAIILEFTLVPLLLFRVIKLPIGKRRVQMKAIFLAPLSLTLISYINVAENKNFWFAVLLYAFVFIAFVYNIINMPTFLNCKFRPVFSSLTFPMAAVIVASNTMSSYLNTVGYHKMAHVINELAGIQTYIATAIIGYVLYNFGLKIGRAHV